MKKRIIKIILKIVIIILSSTIIGMTINSSVENIKIGSAVKKFVEDGVYQESLSDSKNKYYKVSRETYGGGRSYTVKNGYITYGGPGDIVVGLKVNAFNIPGLKELVEFYFGGHAASNCYDETYNGTFYKSNFTIESKPSGGVDCVSSIFWNDTSYQTEVIALRVKTTEEKRREAFHYMANQIGKKYNYSFVFNRNKTFYCSDIVSRAYARVGHNLNYDGFYVSIQDLICSPDTYISFYKKTSKGINYYYYIE